MNLVVPVAENVQKLGWSILGQLHLLIMLIHRHKIKKIKLLFSHFPHHRECVCKKRRRLAFLHTTDKKTKRQT